MPEPRLLLASGSPRRAELLRAAGIPFDARTPDVDETCHQGEGPEAYVLRLATAKARAVATEHPNRPVLGADTTVVVNGQLLAKPVDPDDAARMLRLLSGRSHVVLTGVCLILPPDRVHAEVASTTVEFVPLTEADIEAYIGSREPMDKAGAYAIQGLGSRFVARIDGSYSNVVGLPVALLWSWLANGAAGDPFWGRRPDR